MEVGATGSEPPAGGGEEWRTRGRKARPPAGLYHARAREGEEMERGGGGVK